MECGIAFSKNASPKAFLKIEELKRDLFFFSPKFEVPDQVFFGSLVLSHFSNNMLACLKLVYT